MATKEVLSWNHDEDEQTTMSASQIRRSASSAWIEVARLEVRAKSCTEEDRADALADLRCARAAAHYWQEIINLDRGWT